MDPRITSTVDHFRRTYLEGIPHTIRNETAFLSFVCMMAAIEGLAGFCEPDGSGPGANGPRFRSFVTTYFPHEYRPHAAGLWRLRNGLAHAFSPRGFLLTHHTAAAHLKTSSGVPCLNAEDFYAALKAAANAYFKALEESPELQSRFVRRWEGTSGGAFHVGEYDFD